MRFDLIHAFVWLYIIIDVGYRISNLLYKLCPVQRFDQAEFRRWPGGLIGMERVGSKASPLAGFVAQTSVCYSATSNSENTLLGRDCAALLFSPGSPSPWNVNPCDNGSMR